MPHFRVQYEGYMEVQMGCQEDAVAEFANAVKEDIDDGRNILVEEWNDEEQEWEVV